ncbi:uncharacterized protein [Centruroides vittatus]|uniref:uncharacterized protein n=1 Tax=Centruroides vittatus TaxID=120091 RepID=UPI0035106691
MKIALVLFLAAIICVISAEIKAPRNEKLKGRRPNNKIEALIKERKKLDNLKEELKKEGKRAKPEIKQNDFMNRLQEKKLISGMKKEIGKIMPEAAERKEKSALEDERHQDKSKSGLHDTRSRYDDYFLDLYFSFCCDLCNYYYPDYYDYYDDYYGYFYYYENRDCSYYKCVYNCFNYWCYFDYQY